MNKVFNESGLRILEGEIHEGLSIAGIGEIQRCLFHIYLMRLFQNICSLKKQIRWLLLYTLEKLLHALARALSVECDRMFVVTTKKRFQLVFDVKE